MIIALFQNYYIIRILIKLLIYNHFPDTSMFSVADVSDPLQVPCNCVADATIYCRFMFIFFRPVVILHYTYYWRSWYVLIMPCTDLILFRFVCGSSVSHLPWLPEMCWVIFFYFSQLCSRFFCCDFCLAYCSFFFSEFHFVFSFYLMDNWFPFITLYEPSIKYFLHYFFLPFRVDSWRHIVSVGPWYLRGFRRFSDFSILIFVLYRSSIVMVFYKSITI